MTDARDTEHPARLGERVTWLALVVAIVGLLQAGTPARVTVLSLIVVVVTLAASLRWRLGWAAILILLAVGVALRLAPATGFSDVLVVSQAAGRELLAGGNPYGHGYVESVPPGAPFAYGPLALLWYLPSLDRPASLELLASLVVLGLLAVRGRPLGLAVYAVTPAFVVAATDGSNDTTAGLLILVALLAALRWPVAGAILLALATAFKPYALAWLPGLIGYAGSIGPLVAFLVASAVAWLPALVAWGPGFDGVVLPACRRDPRAAVLLAGVRAGQPGGRPQGSVAVVPLRASASSWPCWPCASCGARPRWSSSVRSSSRPPCSWATGRRSPTSRPWPPSSAGISMTGWASAAGASPGPAIPSAP